MIDAALKAALDQRILRMKGHDGVVLVQVPQVPFEALDPVVADRRGYFAYPPQALLYLSAVLGGLGVQRRIVDLNFVSLNAARQGSDAAAACRTALNAALATFKRPVIGISLMFDSTFAQFKAVCAHVRGLCPEALILVGGVAASADPEKVLASGDIDVVFAHEGEETLRRFYAYARNEAAEPPANLFLRGLDGAVLSTGTAPGGEIDLDVRAEYALIPIADYHKVGSLSNFSRMFGIEQPFATAISRRGCRAHCSFCGVRNFNGAGVRVRAVDGVIDEMEHLHKEYGITHFDWLDDDLLYDRKGFVDLFDQIAQRLPNITWAANNGLIASAVTPEILDVMRRSGCIGYKIGLESGNAEVLRKVHKPTNLPKFFEFAEISHDYPTMLVAVNFIMGFPGELFDQMLDSFRAAMKAGLDWNNFYIYQHLKNTEMYLAYGGTSGSVVEAEFGKEGLAVSFNPVRGGMFEDTSRPAALAVGYDVFDLDPNAEPSRAQLKEIWFTFNTVANFLRMPALTTESEPRLRNGIRWMEALCQAYPQDPVMVSLLHALAARAGDRSKAELGRLKNIAHDLIGASEYWRRRDGEFGYSAFLEGAMPELDPRVGASLGRSAPLEASCVILPLRTEVSR